MRTTTAPLDITANDQLLQAEDYEPLVVAYRNGAAVQAVRTLRTLQIRSRTSGQPGM